MSTLRSIRARLRRRRLLLLAAAILALAGVVVWVVRPAPDLRPGSAVLRKGSVDVGRRVPKTYRISYRIEDRSGDDAVITKSDVTVERPFASRVDDNVNAFGRFSIRGTAFWVPPGPPEGDLRPDVMLDEAVRDGFARSRELRRVSGRTCRVFRTAAGSGAPSLPRLEGAEELTDVCVDEAGLVLEEVTYDSGKIARRRVAVRVSEHPSLAGGAFDVKKPKGDPRQIGSLQELEPDSRLPGGTFWELAKAPKGFTSRGRFAVVPAGQPGFSDPTARSGVITFVSEVWTDGPNVVVIEQGATQGSKPFEPDADARDVRVGGLGKGQLLYSMTASEVRFATGGVRFVRVRGPLAPSRLLAIARSLEAKPGGPLRLKH